MCFICQIGCSLALLGRSWLLLGALGALLAALGPLFGVLGPLLASVGRSCAALGRSWSALGGLLGCPWGALGALLRRLPGSLAPGRPGPREARNGPAAGSGGSRLRRPKTHGTAARELGQRGGGKDFGSQAAPPTLARGYQDLKILDPRHE